MTIDMAFSAARDSNENSLRQGRCFRWTRVKSTNLPVTSIVRTDEAVVRTMTRSWDGDEGCDRRDDRRGIALLAPKLHARHDIRAKDRLNF